MWLNAAAAARRGTSRPLVAAFASATLAGVWEPALARYPANRRYFERTLGVAGGIELEGDRSTLARIEWGQSAADAKRAVTNGRSDV